METSTLNRTVDILVALASAAGSAIAVWAIISSERAMAQAGEYADGLEALGLCLGLAALPFFIPSLLCTLLAMRTGLGWARITGRTLVVTGFCGGPPLLFIAFATIVWG
ncbi:MAG: hypothetical protein ACJ72L_11970 [Marmoricola sp.]